jgi:hypothetical protein
MEMNLEKVEEYTKGLMREQMRILDIANIQLDASDDKEN